MPSLKSLGLPLEFLIEDHSPMTNRVAYAPRDVQNMCKQAERDHEARKLTVLMERVKRQIAEREGGSPERGKGPAGAMKADGGILRLPNRSVPLER